MKNSLHRLSEKLVWKAFIETQIGSPTNYICEHKPYHLWPERCKPGRMIMNLSEQEKEAVKNFKVEHFNHRIK